MVSVNPWASSLTGNIRIASVLRPIGPVLPLPSPPPPVIRGGTPPDWLMDESGAPLTDEGGGELA